MSLLLISKGNPRAVIERFAVELEQRHPAARTTRVLDEDVVAG